MALPLFGQIVVGGIVPEASAELDVQSTTRGLLPPRMTTAQRNSIASPATGLMVFNTTLNCTEMNIGTASVPNWICLSIANTASAPSSRPTLCRSTALTPITHTTTRATGIGTPTGLPSGVTATWASNTITISGTPTVAGIYDYSIPLTGGLGNARATGRITVEFNTASTASSNQVAVVNTAITPILYTTTGATGIGTAVLPAGVRATWASNTITISGTPTASGTFNYSIRLAGGCGSVNATGTIAVERADCGAFVAAGVWKLFRCHNLGAVTTADPLTPSWQLNGSYYQWGIRAVAAAAPTDGTSTGANAGAITGWNTTPAADGAWSDASKTANDPCPTGFRLPTSTEWAAVINPALNPTRTFPGTWSSNITNYTSGMRIGSGTSGLFLPAAGYRGASGALSLRGLNGLYWSSTEEPNGTQAFSLSFGSTSASIEADVRRSGYSVRCIAQ